MRGAPGVHTDPRGAILLEIVLALGIFVATAMTLLGVVATSVDGLNRSRDQLAAADHARNALAMIEAGIARPESLNGPVAAWAGLDDAGMDDGSDLLGMGMPDPGGFGAADTGMDAEPAGPDSDLGGGLATGEDTGWSLEIETEPANVPGLSVVRVRAFRTDLTGGEIDGGASVTLRQIMALEADDAAGDAGGGFGEPAGWGAP